MADNYLERKYEEFRRGKTVIRRSGMSLDSLLSSAAETPGPDSGYRVDKAQTEAALASARRLGIDFEASFPEGNPAELALACRNSYELGAVCTAIRLKAAELRLCAEVHVGGDGAHASVRIFRPGA